MSDSWDNTLETELESLEAIYVNELTYSRNPDETVDKIELLIHPATGHDVTKQYVCMTLVFKPGPKYPYEPPEIEIRNPRGVGEEEISSLVKDMIVKAEDMRGESMLYTLIEMAKDSLTEGNIPHCPCVVCLEHFHDRDSFHRTACYHYFHTHCLYKYLLHMRAQIEEEEREITERRHLDVGSNDKGKTNKIMCPVCRSYLDEESLAVTCSVEELKQDEKAEEFVIPPSLKEQQLKMAQLYALQKAKGGIIDVEHERNKYLLNAEDRMPIRSQMPTLTTASEDKTSRSPRKNDTKERKRERSKGSGGHSGSSQQYNSKGRSRGKPHQELDNQNKSRPGPRPRAVEGKEGRDSHPAVLRSGTVDSTESRDDQPAGSRPSTDGSIEVEDDHSSTGDVKKMEKTRTDMRKVENFSEGKDAVSVKSENLREYETITKMRRDHYHSEKRSDYDREESGTWRRGLRQYLETEDRWGEDVSSGNFKHDHREAQKQKDDRSDGYKSTPSEQTGVSLKTDDAGRDRRKGRGGGTFAGGPHQKYYPHKENDDKFNEVSQRESVTRLEKSTEVRNDRTDLIRNEDQSSRKVSGTNVGFGGRVNEMFVEVKEKSRENRGGSGGYKNTGGSGNSLTSSMKDEETDVQNDGHGASGYNRHFEKGIDFHENEEYKRADRGGEQMIRKEYGQRERGGDNHRGRGSESRYKDSKFHDRRGGHTGHFDKTHVRSDRFPERHQYHQQHAHHHSRQGQERERVDRQVRNSLRDEDNEGSGTSIKGACGSDTTSEAGTQDDEDADSQNRAAGSPWHISTFEYSDTMNKLKKEAGRTVALTVPSSDSINATFKTDDDIPRYHYKIDSKMNTIRPDCRDYYNNVGKNINYISNDDNEEEFEIHKNYCESEQGMSYVGYDEDEGENWDDEIDIYEYERCMIRPHRLAEYDRQVAPRKKYYQDKLKERCEQQRDGKSGRRSVRERSWRREFDTASLKQAVSQGEDILQAESVFQPDVTVQVDSMTQSDVTLQLEVDYVSQPDVTLQVDSASPPDVTFHSNSAYQPDVTFKVNSVLKLLKDEHAKKDMHSIGMKENKTTQAQTSAIISENDAKFVFVTSRKISQESICKGYSTQEESIWMAERNNKSILYNSVGHMSSECINRFDHASTRDWLIQNEFASANISDESFKVQSIEMSRSTMADRSKVCGVFSTSRNKNALATKDECLSSSGSTLSSLDSSCVPLGTEIVSPVNTKDNSNLHERDTDNLKSTVHINKGTIDHSDCKAAPLSFKKTFRKAPPLKFPKKNQQNKPKASLESIPSLAVTGERFPTDKTSVASTSLPSFEQVVTGGCSEGVKQISSVPNNRIPPPETTSAMLNTSLPLTLPELSAPLVNDYITSYLLHANLLSGYDYGLGFNPFLLGLGCTYTGNASNLVMNESYVLDHINNLNIASSNNMNLTANMGGVSDAGFSNVTVRDGSGCVGVQGTGDNRSSDSVNMFSQGAK